MILKKFSEEYNHQMILGATIIIVFLFFVIITFAFQKLSPIPYYPSNKKDLPLIIKALKLTNNHTVVDLGAGDGKVVFEAAKKTHQQGLNTKFIAVEINPLLVAILNIRRHLSLNRENIQIVWADLFKFKLNSSPVTRHTVYLYVSPWLIEKIVKNVRKQLPNVHFVSYFYPIKSLRKKQIVRKGVNSVFSYQV